MKFEYEFEGLSLKVLDETFAKSVLTFYYDNQEDFDRFEADKPANYYTLEYIKSVVRAEHNAFINGVYARFFLFSNDLPGKILGTISFSNINHGSHYCHVGYKIDKNYRNLGLATIMLKNMLPVMAKEKSMHRIEAYVHPDNQPSLKLVNKLGFIPEGTAHAYAKINGIWTDHLRYVYISDI